jgi:hypothetical protein
VKTSFFFPAVLAAIVATGGVTAQAQDLASIFIRVTDGSGAPVTDLQPDEVTIVEDGESRLTVAVERVDWPIKLTILVDNNSQMRGVLSPLRDGLRELIAALPDGVELEIVTTSPQPRFIVRMTTDHAEALAGLDRIAPDTSGFAAFVDGLVEASDRIQDDDSPHFPVILTIAGNGPDPALSGGYSRKVQRLMDQTAAKPATFHATVWMDPGQRTTGQVVGATQTVVGSLMTEMTGGRYEQLAISSRLNTLLPELGEQIGLSHYYQSSQYRVTYQRPTGATAAQGTRADLFRVNVEGFLSFDGRIP